MTQKPSIYALIMAGGQGTRLWPESTPACPKQFSKVFGEESLLQVTFQRLEESLPRERIFIVTTEAQKAICLEQLAEKIQPDQIILEPQGRNTAPCIFLGIQALRARGITDDASIAVLPSDHIILDKKGFGRTLSLAAKNSLKEKALGTIGIKPHFPHTAYGYIEKGEQVEDKVFQVKRFVEKPSEVKAKEYLASGNFAWNAGMFVGSLAVWLEAFETCSPSISSHGNDLFTALKNQSSYEEVYGRLTAESIDYEIMEKFPRILCIEADFDWNDLGSWSALEDSFKPSKAGNIIFNQNQKTIELESSGNIVKTHDQVVALYGVQDLIIVNSEAGLLIIPKNKSQKVKDIVAEVKKE